MNSDWLTWAALAMAAGFGWSSWQARRNITDYQTEIRRLKEQARALESLQDASSDLDSLLAEVNEAVLRLDGKGMVCAANPCACQLFNINPGRLPAPLLQFYRDADWNTQLKQAMKSLPERTLLPVMEASGHVLTPRIAQLQDGQALLLCMDVTEQHRLELQRRTFLSNLMHDLKTPLTSLLGYARSMESFGEDADFRKEAASVIAEEAKHVNQLLDALLTLDQAEYAQRDDQACCNAIEVVNHICNMLAPQCQEKGINLKLKNRTDMDEVEVAMSEEDVDRVITNLVSNAIEYAPEDSTIRVSFVSDNDQCTVSVKDEGDGIPEHEIPRVTERFYRVDKARTRSIAGHGLGLAIVKELLEANAGKLELSNRKSGGLCAAFTIPLCQHAEDEEQA